MKFQKMLIAGFLVTGLLAGCGSDSTSGSEPKEDPKPSKQEAKNKEVKKDKDGKMILTEVGQYSETDSYRVELKKIKMVNETVDIAPLKVIVQDIKVFEMTDLNDEFAESLSFNTGRTVEELKNGFTYIQVNYQAENTVDQNIEWYDLMNIVTDKGQQIDGQMEEFLGINDFESEFIGKVKRDFTDGFALKDGDINKVKLIFGYTMNGDSYDKITKEQTVEYELN